MSQARLKLLLVESNPQLVSSIANLLSGTNPLCWEIEIAYNPGAALEKISRRDFDIYLMGLSFTENDYRRLLEKAREKHYGGAVVILDSTGDDDLAPALSEGADSRISVQDLKQPSHHLERQSLEIQLLMVMLARKNKEIESKATQIEELNTTLNVILRKIGRESAGIEEKIETNLKVLVFPSIELLKGFPLRSRQREYVDILERNLREIFSPFLKNLTKKSSQLSYSESKVADLIREGKSSKEIADILSVSEKTVLTHRYHMRTKLGLKNKSMSLMSYLVSLQ